MSEKCSCLLRFEPGARSSYSNLGTLLLGSAIAHVTGDPFPAVLQREVLTPVGILDREKKLGVVRELTDIVAAAAGDPSVAKRTWVLISESPDGGWGIAGHAYLNAEIAEDARAILGGGHARTD